MSEYAKLCLHPNCISEGAVIISWELFNQAVEGDCPPGKDGNCVLDVLQKGKPCGHCWREWLTGGEAG